MRLMIAGTIAAAAIALGLWSVWLLEARSASGAGAGDAEFVYPLPKDADAATPDLMIMCPEDSLSEPSEAFAKWLKLDGFPVGIPGGTMVLARLNDVTVEDSLKPLQRTAVEILKRYSPHRVVLVAHTHCIYYDSVAAWNDDLSGVREREIADMRASVEVLRSWFPRAEVSGYLAEEDPDRGLVFRPLDKITPSLAGDR